MSQSKRVQRVERELLETLSHHLLHSLGGALPCFASITAVEVTPNLRHAKVFFRLVGTDSEVKATTAMLEKERSHFQREAAGRLKDSKFTPVLRFEFGSVPQLDEVDQLFENLRRRSTLTGD